MPCPCLPHAFPGLFRVCCMPINFCSHALHVQTCILQISMKNMGIAKLGLVSKWVIRHGIANIAFVQQEVAATASAAVGAAAAAVAPDPYNNTCHSAFHRHCLHVTTSLESSGIDVMCCVICAAHMNIARCRPCCKLDARVW